MNVLYHNLIKLTKICSRKRMDLRQSIIIIWPVCMNMDSGVCRVLESLNFDKFTCIRDFAENKTRISAMFVITRVYAVV